MTGDVADPPIDNTSQSQTIYRLARSFLLGLPGVTEEVLERHIALPAEDQKPRTLANIYLHLLQSAQNTGMKPAVIGKAIGGLDNLGRILCDFEPAAVVSKYGDDSAAVLADVERELQPTGKIRKEAGSIWPIFCGSVVSGARFLDRFADAADFYDFTDAFDRDIRKRPALPLLLDREIIGFGFPLACDFIKELGYANYCKPDVHLKRAFVAMSVTGSGDDFTVYKAIIEFAGRAGVYPYTVDRIFWLIGSGYFWQDDLRFGRQVKHFLAYLEEQMRAEGTPIHLLVPPEVDADADETVI